MKYHSSTILDKTNWDKFILDNNANYFNYSFFLDSCAKNWGVYFNEKDQKGFVVCFNVVFGKKILYPPIYGRTTDFINMDQDEINNSILLLQNEFEIGVIQTESKLDFNFILKKYQYLNDVNLNTLSKRMIKKSQKSFQLSENNNLIDIIYLIKNELSNKVAEITDENVKRLLNLCKLASENNMLKVFKVFDGEKLVSGLIFIKTENILFYVLGASQPLAKKNGAMYFAMSEAINYALTNDLKLDFGGSNVDGIRRFYLSFGGIDQNYYSIEWNHAPFWFKFLRFVNKKLRLLAFFNVK